MVAPRKSKIHTGVRIPPAILKKIDALIESEQYLNRSDVIVEALEMFFQGKERITQKEELKAWMVSEEGETYLKNLIRKVRDKKV